MMEKRRVVLKLSGSAFSDAEYYAVTHVMLTAVTQRICDVLHGDEQLQLIIVVGGGNFRGNGKIFESNFHDQTLHDYNGMLFTVSNTFWLLDALRDEDVRVTAMSALGGTLMTSYCRDKALEELNLGKTLLLAGGLGKPGFSTDSAAVVYARELLAEMVIKATNVNGVFTDDPKKNRQAELLESISCHQFLAEGLKVVDPCAVALAEQYKKKIGVFNFFNPKDFYCALMGIKFGSLIYP